MARTSKQEGRANCSKRLTVRYTDINNIAMPRHLRTPPGNASHLVFLIVILALISPIGRLQASTEMPLDQRLVQQYEKQAGLGSTPELKRISGYISKVGNRVASALSSHRQFHFIFDPNPAFKSAFALPGGYLFIQRGLLEAADDESELAGVVAHEMSHVVGRHGHKLMKRATIASIFYQAAQVAAVILTGGVVGVGLYYALQYGFFGLGLVLNLKLLGVSRDYEKEADQLGVQYAWNAGYDPAGFIRFFDKMATKKGYVNGASWFRTHPPFYDRIL